MTPWAVACQAPLFMEFSRQAYWSGLPFPSPGIFPAPAQAPAPRQGLNSSPPLQADCLPFEPPEILGGCGGQTGAEQRASHWRSVNGHDETSSGLPHCSSELEWSVDVLAGTAILKTWTKPGRTVCFHYNDCYVFSRLMLSGKTSVTLETWLIFRIYNPLELIYSPHLKITFITL